MYRSLPRSDLFQLDFSHDFAVIFSIRVLYIGQHNITYTYTHTVTTIAFMNHISHSRSNIDAHLPIHILVLKSSASLRDRHGPDTTVYQYILGSVV